MIYFLARALFITKPLRTTASTIYLPKMCSLNCIGLQLSLMSSALLLYYFSSLKSFFHQLIHLLTIFTTHKRLHYFRCFGKFIILSLPRYYLYYELNFELLLPKLADGLSDICTCFDYVLVKTYQNKVFYCFCISVYASNGSNSSTSFRTEAMKLIANTTNALFIYTHLYL